MKTLMRFLFMIKFWIITFLKKTSKSLFSEKDLNTKIKDGQKDFESLEKDLNNYFVKDFKPYPLRNKARQSQIFCPPIAN